MTKWDSKSISQQVAESSAREAKDSPADHWSTAYIQDCRDGKREPMFTPRPSDPGQSGAPSGKGGGS